MPTKAKNTAKKVRKNVRKTNLTKLYNHMNKMSQDAVDSEVMKKFKVLIDSAEEDLSKIIIDSLISDPKTSDTSIFPEGLQPYVKHFIFMKKRDKNLKKV
jgi:tRNA A37 methylthiotransferase MiaB